MVRASFIVWCTLAVACRSETPEAQIVTTDDRIQAPVTVTGLPRSRNEIMREELARLRASGARNEADALQLTIDLDTCRVLDGDPLAQCLAAIESRGGTLAASPALDAGTRAQVEELLKLVHNAQKREVLR